MSTIEKFQPEVSQQPQTLLEIQAAQPQWLDDMLALVNDLRAQQGHPPNTLEDFIAVNPQTGYVILTDIDSQKTEPRVVGMMGMQPVTGFYPGRPMINIPNAIVAESHRGSGLGRKLAEQVYESLHAFYHDQFPSSELPAMAYTANINPFPVPRLGLGAELYGFSAKKCDLNRMGFHSLYLNEDFFFFMHGMPIQVAVGRKGKAGWTNLYTSPDDYRLITCTEIQAQHGPVVVSTAPAPDHATPAVYVLAARGVDYPDLKPTAEQLETTRALLVQKSIPVSESGEIALFNQNPELLAEVMRTLGIQDIGPLLRYNHIRQMQQYKPVAKQS